jgi:hypothetical protein
MATYGNIPTGYQDDGPLGALWAGGNAAAQRQQNEMANIADIMDMMAKRQTYDQATAMNPLRVQELQGTNEGTRLANVFGQHDLPRKQYESDLAKVVAQSKMMDPRYVPGMLESEIAGNQKKVDEAGVYRRTMDSTVGSTNATNQAAIMKQANDLIPTLMMIKDPARALQYLQRNGVEPGRADMLMEQWQQPGGLKRLQEALINSVGHQQEMAKIKAQGDNSARSASISAAGQVAAAKKQADAAIIAGNKAAMSAIIGTTAQLHAQHKAEVDAISESIDKMLPEDKRRDPEGYKAMVFRRDALQKQVEDSTAVMLKLAKGIAEGSDALGGGKVPPANQPAHGAVLPDGSINLTGKPAAAQGRNTTGQW